MFLVIFLTSCNVPERICQHIRHGKKEGRFKEEKHKGLYNQIISSPHACEESSCYPATGNLLIGREDKLQATSTCGLHDAKRYCIVSHLQEKKKCFFCDSRPHQKNNPVLYHGIENIVSRIGKKKKTWWQSENGVENVAIQLDLEAEFHFTHLIITFKTFRPAAMLIERSHDFGQTWKVYQYYAYDCAESFPGVPLGPRQHINDVVCDSHYSGVEPSTEGEVIFRVLPPNIPVVDPYSISVQNLLKMTNLRINFTKLHTLGDNLLDSREKIKEKYYYSIYDMTVRGSCSCYGHASRCIADEHDQLPRTDMVYGKCECTHNTKGSNCEKCEDLFNDQQWQPAIGRQTNACKKCNCHGHATKCHFDPAVFEATGRISGGVCDDCQHNTMGRLCEQCKPFFFQDPGREPHDPHICQPCDCDPQGSLDDGICDSHTDAFLGLTAGSCHCKANVEGWRCDRCKNGFWNFQAENPDGCEACTCDTLGTIDNQGCNVYTGECVCKRNVVGRDCNQCLPEYWGLSADEEGCKACDCDPGGALESNCDVKTGQCRCRYHVIGRRCDQPEPGYFVADLDYLVYEAELGKGSSDCQVLVREPYADRDSSWTGLGFMRVFEGSTLEFDINDVPASMEYDIVIRYESQVRTHWQEARVTLERPGPIDPTGACANTIPHDDKKVVSLPHDERYVVVYPPTCLEKGKNYKLIIDFKHYDRETDTPSASVLIDSVVLIPRADSIPFFQGTPINEYRRQEYERLRCGSAYYNVLRPVPHDVCKKYLYSIGFYVYGEAQECECDPMGSLSTQCDLLGGKCPCKSHVVGRKCDRCAPGTYGFGPAGCRPCDCNSIGSLDNFCDVQSGQCKCRPSTYGQQCNKCQPGFWNYPNCQRCDCNGNADTCDTNTGYCIDCRDYTAGPKCDRCEVGFYGDPRIGIRIPCRPCSCPDTINSGINHARGCDIDPHTQNIICHCDIGYSGEKCDRCSDNYYGNPSESGGICQECNCNNNIDIAEPGNCNPKTGECLKCLYNTDGYYCERCKPGYFGDATRQQCRDCGCSILGTDPNGGYCNPETGQCPCLPNVEGLDCSVCAPNYWKIASGMGCEPCNCDQLGSYSSQCNEFTGECSCKIGHGGQRCDECERNYWGDPNLQCYPCECNHEGSASSQCHRSNGTCVCIEGVAGDRCDQCARGYTGHSPHCEPCGECFNNWNDIIQELKDRTLRLIDAAQRIKQTGTTGAYTKEFEEMEEQLKEVREILASANITGSDIEDLQILVNQIRSNLTDSQNLLDSIENELENTNQRIANANLALSDLRKRKDSLEHDSELMKNNATILQEANVEGALNITKEAQRRSRAAESEVRDAQTTLYKSEGNRGRTERLLGRTADRYNQTYYENELALNKTEAKINELENQIPDINVLVCGERTRINECGGLCGGANCPTCGSESCTEGAVSKARSALELAKDSERILKTNEKNARELLTAVKEAEKDAEEALNEAQLAFQRAQAAKNQSENVSAELEQLLDNLDKFLTSEGARPSEIRTLAEDCLKLSISLQPHQITELAEQINDTIQSLTNIDAILQETADDKNIAKSLKDRADRAKKDADAILDIAKKVLDALEKAKEAQELARDAINKAREDIRTAKTDLAEINSETRAAEDTASKSMEDIEGLKNRLIPLKKQFTENELNARKANDEAEKAGKLADEAEVNAIELERKYNETLQKLNGKAKLSDDAKNRAENLRRRAMNLAEDANSKLTELQAMEDEFDKNERRLKDYSDILDKLNQEMMDHLNVIEERSAHYRVCQP